ncbi:mechanosensitive ion channel family protein [Acuticoccus sp. MNP-M23]|uniref:mechanosensitive ion channel family protein n=1 Tax=Acuticoccus sp. MNP-M23 TaxID=3072793 RepID=UPI0028159660|nr:mechanosensitive ion channel family protein [Acuticoccus sp. MNP-M23]WMS43801.1 mechanosensitive ion channel family protein [Acuticoccus sp. MNP-M23]
MEELSRIHAIFPEAGFVAPAAASAPPSLDDAFAAAVVAAKSFPADLASAIAAAGGLTPILYMLAAIAAGIVAEWVVRLTALRGLGKDAPGAASGRLRDRAPRAARYVASRLIALAVFTVVAFMAGRLLHLDSEARILGRAVIMAVVFARILYLFVSVNAAPAAPQRRLMGFTDAEARVVQRAGVAIAIAVGLIGTLRGFVTMAVGTHASGELPRLALAVALGLATVLFFTAIRRPLGNLIGRSLASDGEAKPGWGTRIARRTVSVFIILVILDVMVKCLGALGLLGAAAASGAGSTVFLLVLAPLVIAGIRIWVSELDDNEKTPMVLAAFALAEGAVIVGIASLLFTAWGIQPFGETEATGFAAVVPRIMEAGVIVVVGVAVWRAILGILGEAHGDDAEDDAAPVEHGEMGGGGGDRMDTILPILRGASFVLVILVTMFTALTSLGVNIAPLIASAGVLGLAIGFGAQTLVTDIISGLFYLYEDALRVGEYIETDAGGGAVERISLRSATLRHSRGALITVPFSKMGTIRNNSRDWAVMKFSFRVPADTDVEMVRKLVKKVGEEMALNPELKDSIIAPLKSQGAISITGRSYEIGCKFTAVPGQQFGLRRHAFAKLQKALKEKGVSLAGQDLDLSQIANPAKAA